MKFYIICLFLMVGNCWSKDEYVVPIDVLAARDKAVDSLNKYRNKILERYFILSQKKDLTVQETDELSALSIVIYDKDATEYLNKRLEKHQKVVKQKK